MKSLFLCLLLIICPQLSSYSHAVEDGAHISPTMPAEFEDPKTVEKEHEQDAKFGQVFVKMVVMLSITLLLFVVGAYLTKRYLHSPALRGQKTGVIQVIEKRSLSAKSAIYLVEIEGDKVIVAEFPNGGSMLRQMRFDEKKG